MEMSELTIDESLSTAPHQVFLPGCFVVLQGIAGDGLSNTIETTPSYDFDVDGEIEEEDNEELEEMASPLEEDHFHPGASLTANDRITHATSTLAATTTAATPTAATARIGPVATASPARAFSSSSGPRGLLLSHIVNTQNTGLALNMSNRALPAAAAAGTTSQQSLPEDSFVVVNSDSDSNTPTRIHMYAPNPPARATNNNRDTQTDRRKKQAIDDWSQDVWERQRLQRKEWLLQERQQQQQHQHRVAGGAPSDTRSNSQSAEDDWWLDSETGYLALYEYLPQISAENAIVTGKKVGKLSPGSTIVAKKLYTLDSETLQVIHIDDEERRDPDNPPLSPSIGCIQVLQVQLQSRPASPSTSPPTTPTRVSPSLRNLSLVNSEDEVHQPESPTSTNNSSATGYCVYSVHGYPFLIPGIPALYLDPQVWWWRVTCRVGAFLRQGLELSSDHHCTIPHGSFVKVTRKTVNRMGLSRLRVVAQYEGKQVDGWCSEFLNPLSGQRGHVVQPLPFPVPSLYRVTLKEGAVIREQVELSSRQIGHAPSGTVLTIVQRQFSEHPQDQCVERLKLAGGKDSGWISVRLNQVPPNDKCVVELVGVDPRFDPNHPGDFHWQLLNEQWARQQEQASSPSGSPVRTGGNPKRPSRGGDDISSIGDGSPNESGAATATATSPTSPAFQTGSSSTKGQQRHNANVIRSKSRKHQEAENCLICLTEERNATIVHGETGHIACCLVCARILKARGDRCPVCRLEIDSVIQHFWA